jgi:hypothetical protein
MWTSESKLADSCSLVELEVDGLRFGSFPTIDAV